MRDPPESQLLGEDFSPTNETPSGRSETPGSDVVLPPLQYGGTTPSPFLVHQAFRKMAPDQLLKYISEKLAELEKAVADVRALECGGHNLRLDSFMEQMDTALAAPRDLEKGFNRLKETYNLLAASSNRYGNSKMPNRLQRFLKMREDVREYIERLHELYRDTLNVHSSTIKTTTGMAQLINAANAAVANHCVDLTEDIGV
ncbi:hypothetical protein BDY19DRAFT_994052 [Irpex rosettiformis]|uniref:Uncharacterized protein n=1 Tax=Irpex rosettiformis TaxID=378272 RepID=A0ACB8U331_9APHY|nr:hypothetical protein BDY19DRAFT_994052 [Irpex rosettiformis]